LTDLDITADFKCPNFLAEVRTLVGKQSGPIMKSDVASITSIYAFDKNITSVEGIEHFTALTHLSVHSNQLTAIDVSKNLVLDWLNVNGNQLKTLDVSKNTVLRGLDVQDNLLTTLDVSSNLALESLSPGWNQLTSLDVSKNTLLRTLIASENQLKTLDVSNNPALRSLWVQDNQLTTLNVSNNPLLERLLVRSNQLTSVTLHSTAPYSEIDVRWNNLQNTSAVTGRDISWDSVNFRFDPQITIPIHGITLSQTTLHTFPSAIVGYEAQTPLNVTITNMGNQPTSALTVALSGANSSRFTLSGTSVPGISAGSTADFTVTPNTGLAIGTYTATVTVSGANLTSRSFNVSFTVTAVPVHSVSLNRAGTHTFAARNFAQAPPGALSVTVRNSGNQPTGPLNVALSNDSFEFVTPTTLPGTPLPSMPVGSTTHSFSLRPKQNQPVGTHVATVTVSGGNGISQSFTVVFTVNRAAGATVSAVPTVIAEETTATSITVNAVSNSGTNGQLVEYAISTSTATPTRGWQTERTFDELSHNTAYYVFARTAANESYNAGAVRRSAIIRTAAHTHEITLSRSGTHIFASAPLDYSAQPALTVTVRNIGTQPTGALNIALDGVNPGSFTLSTTSLSGIAAGRTATFRINPNRGLQVGTHTATVKVSGDNGITASFDVSFEVTNGFEISLNRSGTHTFAAAPLGYSARSALSVTVRNIGTQHTGALNIELDGTGKDNFTLSTASMPSGIAARRTATFRINPNRGLPVGTYTATVTVSGDNGITANFNVSFTVNRAAGAAVRSSPTRVAAATTSSSITVNAVQPAVNNPGNQTVQYAISKTTAVPAVGWQTGTEFTGLDHLTTYYVFARTAENTNHNAGAARRSAAIRTSASDHGISLNRVAHTFKATAFNANPPAALSVRVTNTGSKKEATGPLNVTLSGDNPGSFVLSVTSLSSLAAGRNSSFTIRPRQGIDAGLHTATVTVSGINGITAFSSSFEVRYTVNRSKGATVNSVPIVKETTATSITVFPVLVVGTNPGNQAVEYAISTRTAVPPAGQWRTATPTELANGAVVFVFDELNLDPSARYYVFARAAQSLNSNAGAVRRSVLI
jgi:uncharacterized membrane protein